MTLLFLILTSVPGGDTCEHAGYIILTDVIFEDKLKDLSEFVNWHKYIFKLKLTSNIFPSDITFGKYDVGFCLDLISISNLD
jgi:hypothetical protein